MKTAISVPDATFERVERLARRLGVSRSEFFARAADRWADELEVPHLTQAIDRALDHADEADDAFTAAATRQTIARSDG